MIKSLKRLALTALTLATPFAFLTSCGSAGGSFNPGKAGNLGPLPHPEVRQAQIANEPRGNFFYGRRYFVNKTRLWGYLRKPGEPWKKSKLVIMNEDVKHQPDRYSENGTGDKRYSFDQNYEYKIYGSYTGKKAYDPNSNLFLPEFRLTGYELINKQPGWIFHPRDYYDPYTVTLRPY